MFVCDKKPDLFTVCNMTFLRFAAFCYWKENLKVRIRELCMLYIVYVCLVVHSAQRAGGHCSRVASVECWSWRRCLALLRWCTTLASVNSFSACRGSDTGGLPTFGQHWWFYDINPFPTKQCFIMGLRTLYIQVHLVTLAIDQLSNPFMDIFATPIEYAI